MGSAGRHMDVSAISNLAALAAVSNESFTPVQPVTLDQRAQIQAVKAAVQTVNENGHLDPANQMSMFVDRKTNKVVVRMTNKQTGKVVLQIPNEQVLRMAEEFHGG